FSSWHYPTFNVADMAICIGAGLLILDMFLSKKSQKTKFSNQKVESNS
ncbi:MAG: signal peptidase II, partial [Actinomycetota bacterium]